jgi:hypothetical protein
MKLAVVAIILSAIALAVATSQPLYNVYTSMNTSVSGKPSFDIGDFTVGQFDTQFNLTNNGTATAPDINLRLFFWGPAPVASTQFLPELQKGIQNVVSFEVPIGSFQLTCGGWNRSSYQASVYIECKELSQIIEFTFNL